MKSRFKSNDFFALLIAIALIAIGFVLLFIHQQSSASEAHASNRTDGAVSTEFNFNGDEQALPVRNPLTPNPTR